MLTLKNQSQHSDDYLTIALQHHTRGELSEAKTIYDKILQNNPNDPIALHFKGVIAHQRKNNNEAEILIRKALVINPNYAEAQNNLGVVLKDLNKLDEAMSCYQKAVSIKPDYASGYYNIGVLLKKLGRLDEAVVSYRKALVYNPGNADVHYNLGNTLTELGEFEEAIISFRKTVEINPHHAKGYNHLGNVIKINGKPSEAVSYYQKAIALKPNYAEAHSNLGATYKELRCLNEAELCYRKAIDINPTFTEALGSLGIILQGLGRLSEAISFFRRALDIESNAPKFRHRLDALLGNTTDFAPRKYVEDIFDSYANKFDAHLIKELKYKVPLLLKKSLQDLGLAENKFKNVIDLGCGTGLAGIEFRDIAETLTGIDLSQKMLGKAKAKNIYDKLYVDDIIDRLNSLNCKFDLFISSDVFVYIGNLLPLFQCVRKYSTKNSHFVFSTELSDQDGFSLQNTARYCHSKKYIVSTAKNLGFHIKYFKEINLRYEKDGWVNGGIYVLTND